MTAHQQWWFTMPIYGSGGGGGGLTPSIGYVATFGHDLVTPDDEYNAWPNMLLLADGRVLLTYTKAFNHHGGTTGVAVGKIGTVSEVGGFTTVTWGDEFVICDDPTQWVTIQGCGQTASGKIIASLWKDNGSGSNVGRAFLCSADPSDIETWSAQLSVHSITGLTASYCSGSILQLANGDIILPVEGPLSPQTDLEYASVVCLASQDDGDSWVKRSTNALFTTGVGFNETGYLQRDDGVVVSLHRRATGAEGIVNVISKTFSSDNGTTWGPITTAFDGFGACKMSIGPNGDMMCGTRRSADSGASVFVSRDGGETWPEEVILDSGAYQSEYTAPCFLNATTVMVAYGFQVSASIEHSAIYTTTIQLLPEGNIGWATAGGDAIIQNAQSFGYNVANYGQVRGGAFRDAVADTSYCELLITSRDDNVIAGVVKATASALKYPGFDSDGYAYCAFNGKLITSNVQSIFGGTLSGNGDVLGLKLTGGALTIYKNGTLMGTVVTGLTGTYTPAFGTATGLAGTRGAFVNMGSTPFLYPQAGDPNWL